MLKSKLTNNVQEVILPDFPDDDNTVTTTVTKSRRVSFGTNFVKEFIVGSAVSAQCMSEYEQAFPSSDSSTADSSHSAAESGLLNHSTFVLPETHKPHKVPVSMPPPPSDPDPGKTRGKPSKFSSTICFSVDSPTADMEFTEGCITLAKSILDKKNKEMKVIIQAKPKDVDKSKVEETKYFDGSEFDMSVTRCLKSTENKRKEKIFEGEKTKLFNTFDDEMSMTRVNKPFTDDDSDISWEESKENRLPIDLIMRHLDKDDSDSDNDLFNPSKSFNNLFSPNPFDLPNESEKLNLDESMEITSEFPPNVFKTPAPVSKSIPLAERSGLNFGKSLVAEEMDISFDAPKVLEQSKVVKTTEVVVSEMMEISFESGDVLKQRKSMIVAEEKSIASNKSKVFNADESMEVDTDLPGVVAEDIGNNSLNVEPVISKDNVTGAQGVDVESELKHDNVRVNISRNIEPDSQSKDCEANDKSENEAQAVIFSQESEAVRNESLKHELQPRLSVNKSCLKDGFLSSSCVNTEASTGEKAKQDHQEAQIIDQINEKQDSEIVAFNEELRCNESMQAARPVIATVDQQNSEDLNNESFKDGFQADACSSDSFLSVGDLKDSFQVIDGDQVFNDSKLSCKGDNYGLEEKSIDVNYELRKPDSLINPPELSQSIVNEMSIRLKTFEKIVNESCPMDVCENKTLELKISDMTAPLEEKSVSLEDPDVIASQESRKSDEVSGVIEADVRNLVEEEVSKGVNMSLAMDLTKPAQEVVMESLEISKSVEVSEPRLSQTMDIPKPTKAPEPMLSHAIDITMDISQPRMSQSMNVSKPTEVSEPVSTQVMDITKQMDVSEPIMSQPMRVSEPGEVSKHVLGQVVDVAKPVDVSQSRLAESVGVSKPIEVSEPVLSETMNITKPLDISEPRMSQLDVSEAQSALTLDASAAKITQPMDFSKPIIIPETEVTTPIDVSEPVASQTMEVSQAIELEDVSKSTKETEAEVMLPSSEVNPTTQVTEPSSRPTDISAFEITSQTMEITEPVQSLRRVTIPPQSEVVEAPEEPQFESPVAPQSPDVEREPSLVDMKVFESLKEQSAEPGCVWSLKDFQHPKTRSLGIVSINCKLLESTVSASFSLKMTRDDSLDSCSDVTKTNIELLEDQQHRLPEYFLVIHFGFAQLKKYFEERVQEVRTIRHIPYFLDQINPVVSKMNSFLKQINSILTSYPGSRLEGSMLSFRLFSFPIFFSALVYIDLSHLFRLSQTSLSFEVHFGSFKEGKIREIFQDCLKRENPLYEFVVQSTKYLFDIEKGSGCVSNRRHIRILPSELRL